MLELSNSNRVVINLLGKLTVIYAVNKDEFYVERDGTYSVLAHYNNLFIRVANLQTLIDKRCFGIGDSVSSLKYFMDNYFADK